MARRKTVKLSEIRALTNKILAGSAPGMTEARLAVASMYEHLAMAAGNYHGYNDIVAIWSGEPGKSIYIEDQTGRRQYFGEMTGPDAQAAEEAIRAYRESTDTDAELLRRQALADASARPSQGDTETTCHCGSEYKGWDHCPRCECEQYESLSCEYLPRIESRQIEIGDGHGWLVSYRGDWFVITTCEREYGPETQAFRAYEDGIVRDWDDVATAQGTDKAAALRELVARPVDDEGYVMSPRAEFEAAEREAEERDDEPVDWVGRTYGQLSPDEKRRAARQLAGETERSGFPLGALLNTLPDSATGADAVAAVKAAQDEQPHCCAECTPTMISQATIDEAAQIGREYPDGVHTCAELQALEPGRRPCTCGRCPGSETP